MVKPGIYRHYKDNLYRVIHTATHSETLEKLVVYYPLPKNPQDELAIWVRPLEMFTENVEIEGKTLPRFEWVEEA